MSGVRVRLFGQIIAGGNSPDEGVPRLGGRLLTADWALDLLPVVVAKIRIKKKTYSTSDTKTRNLHVLDEKATSF